jgi:hypothetical protein
MSRRQTRKVTRPTGKFRIEIARFLPNLWRMDNPSREQGAHSDRLQAQGVDQQAGDRSGVVRCDRPSHHAAEPCDELPPSLITSSVAQQQRGKPAGAHKGPGPAQTAPGALTGATRRVLACRRVGTDQRSRHPQAQPAFCHGTGRASGSVVEWLHERPYHRPPQDHPR